MIYLFPLAILSLLSLSFIVPVDAAAEFLDVRVRLRNDRRGNSDPEEKYFHESTFHSHYDGRFAYKPIHRSGARLKYLTALTQTFFCTMANIGIETWIVHGTLLGWWWNQRILPWDSDLDVQMLEASSRLLAKYYNMTEYRFPLPEFAVGRNCLLEINSHYKIGSTEDELNIVDGRWIDTLTGLFIDITTVRANQTARARGIEGALYYKDGHHYLI
jgi:hypothetical protein